MSGALSLLTRGAGIARGAVQSATALANLFNAGSAGLAGFGATLTLGGFAFQEFELPEEITCGGSQHQVTHKMPGGGRRIDVMGPDEADITWSGIFLSVDASAREQEVSAIRRAGAIVPLAFGPVVVPVLVKEFTLKWRDRGFHIPYTITCIPMPPPAKADGDADDQDGDLGDLDGVLGGLSDAANSVGDVVSDVADAAGQALGIASGALAAVSSVVTPLTSALGIQVPFLSQAGAMLGLARGAVGGLASAGAGLQSVSLTGQFQGLQIAAVEDRIDAQPDAAASPATLTASSNDARDAAVGTRSQAGVASAHVVQVAGAALGVSKPLPALPSGDGPTLTGPITDAQAENVFGPTGPIRDPTTLRSVTRDMTMRELNAVRSAGMSEAQSQAAFANAGRPDLYTPP